MTATGTIRFAFLFFLSLRLLCSTAVFGQLSLPVKTCPRTSRSIRNRGQVAAATYGTEMMARAGFHPDFVPALYHLIHAQASRPENTTAYSMHPCWEDRDRDLSHAYVQASVEFARRWPEWYASPGGNPPVIVFAYQPTIKKIGKKQWEILVPMRCENLAGAVEVVLRSEAERREKISLERLPVAAEGEREQRQLTGCTSPTATVSFTIADPAANKQSQTRWTDVYVIDAWGGILARADLPKFFR